MEATLGTLVTIGVVKVYSHSSLFTTLLPLALFGPKVLWLHPACVMVAACTGKTLDPRLHIVENHDFYLQIFYF